MEKAHRYCEDIIELELEDRYSQAVDTFLAVSAAVLTESREVNKKRADNWKKHLDSLDLRERKKKEEEKKKDPLKPLRGLVPFA